MSKNSNLFKQLNNGITVVVPDTTIAANLKQQYSNWAAKNMSAWPSPLIYSWQHWINRLWAQQQLITPDFRIVLNDIQQRVLWRRVIESDVSMYPESVLWNLNASISQARNAWHLVHDYYLDLSNYPHIANDVRVFNRWMLAYTNKLRQRQWLDPQQLPGLLMDSGLQLSPGATELFGFTAFSPLQSRFYTAVCNQPVPDNNISKGAAGDLCVLEFDDMEAEITSCANWARDRYESGPDSSIGILVADLKHHANKVDSIFKSVFVPDYSLDKDQRDVFSSTQNNRLIDQGLIDSALNTLCLLSDRFGYTQFSRFLTDKYMTRDPQFKHDLYRLDVILHRRVTADLNLSDAVVLLKHIQAQGGIDTGELISQLEALRVFQDRFDTSASILQWCDHFSTVLKYLNWPDITLLDSIDRELYRQWDQLLANVGTAGLVHGELTIEQALSLFKDSASFTAFRSQPARITIADINECGGTYFDVAWVCGLSDAVLPGPVKLNPLLPYRLQRERGLPYSSSEDCRYRADLLFAQLTGLAGELRFSFYKTDEHTSYRASSHLARYKLMRVPAETIASERHNNGSELEVYDDETGIAFEHQKAIGGSYLLKSQAQCPFKAYAENRLSVEPIDARDHGLDPAERGNLVHRLMHGLWQSLKTKQALMALTRDEIDALIGREVDNVIASLSQTQKLFVDVESGRLKRLALDWLTVEKNHREDFSVMALELPMTFSNGGLDFNLKIDRVDELEDGTLLVIDYKTGQSSKSLWLDKRLLDPQVPVYCFALGNRVAALCFANTKNLNFDGISKSDVGVKGISQVETSNRGKLNHYENWHQLQQHWERAISTLVDEIKSGYASVTPESLNYCNSCGRQSLCRINQHQSGPGDDDS